MKNIYNNQLYEHYHHPKHKVILAAYTFESGVYNPSCGDRVSLQVLLKDDVLTVIGFQAEGCVISSGSADLIADFLIGKNIKDVMTISKDTITQLIGMELGPNRLRCAFITVEALQNIYKQYQERG